MTQSLPSLFTQMKTHSQKDMYKLIVISLAVAKSHGEKVSINIR